MSYFGYAMTIISLEGTELPKPGNSIPRKIVKLPNCREDTAMTVVIMVRELRVKNTVIQKSTVLHKGKSFLMEC